MRKNKIKSLNFLSDNAKTAMEDTEQTPAAQRERIAFEKYAAEIRQQMESARKIEDLVELEMSAQLFDRKFARNDNDLDSVNTAIRDYKALSETIAQMRRSPEEYFKANLSLKEVGGDFRKQPNSRGLQQLDSNITRLMNRQSFGKSSESPLWGARRDAVRQTKFLLKNLHAEIVKEHTKTLSPAQLAELQTRDRASAEKKSNRGR